MRGIHPKREAASLRRRNKIDCGWRRRRATILSSILACMREAPTVHAVRASSALSCREKKKKKKKETEKKKKHKKKIKNTKKKKR
eukprot:NODE_17892_length_921_cov_2.419395.p2 GENE.NODE_17892_length_921_cov_2.419395~~NODE_17892_length_921_cov_2.419395.p2  ORF type:complete len:85 (+),score=34.72 NODE_17892_length_921_cov_2.419395:572-826(+)